MKKFICIISFLISSLTLAYSQAKLVEKVVRKGNEVVIPYEKYILPNGLTLIIHEDHSDPLVHVDVTYHVGSAREELGKSGFAHFFEHMMFQGSDHVGDDQHFKIVSESGGTLNGTTNRDRTNYFETLPNNQLETALWLEADRMGFLLDAVTQKKFENQRATVKNEKGQRYDNQPYGLSQEYSGKNLYAYGHPYSWQTIGYLEDLDRVSVEDLKKFFLRWYGPNNATLTVGGDVNVKEVIKMTEKYFGSIPKGPEVKDVKLPLPVLEKDRYISYEDNFCRFPLLNIVYPSAIARSEDEPALDCLADILGGGKNSIFYKNLDKPQFTLQSSVGNYTSELAGEFTITAVAFPGKTLAEIEKIITQSLEEFEKRGVTDDDLQRFKANNEAQTLNSIAGVSGKVSKLAEYQTFQKDPNFLPKELKRYQSVTKADVMRVYNQYIKGKHAVKLSVYPKGQSQLVAAANNYVLSKDGYKPTIDPAYQGLKYNKPKDNFDRKKQPVSTKNPVVTIPPFWTGNLNNGLKVIGTKNDEIPLVYMLFSVKGGHILSQLDPSKAGIARLTASLMNEATQNYTTEAINNELEKLGSSITIYASENEIYVSVSSLSKNIDATLKLLEEKLLKPKFDEEDFSRLKKEQLEYIQNQSTRPNVIADNVYNKVLFGSESIRAVPIIGTKTTVENITLSDVKIFYERFFSPSVTNLVVVGDITQDAIMVKLGMLEKWEKNQVSLPTLPATPKIDKTKIYLVNKDKAAQSELRVGYVALPYDATGEYYKATLMNYILGGAFNSRINMNLREDKGYTYGARAGFSGSKLLGTFTVSTGVKANTTDSALVEVVKEIRTYREKGIMADELIFTQKSMGQSEALKYELGLQKATFMKRIIDYNLDKDFTTKQNEILSKITQVEISDIAKKYLPIDQMDIVIVGDKNLVKPSLEKLGYEIIELNTEGDTPKVENKVVTPTQDSTPSPNSKKDKKQKKKKKSKQTK